MWILAAGWTLAVISSPSSDAALHNFDLIIECGYGIPLLGTLLCVLDDMLVTTTQLLFSCCTVRKF